MRGPFGVPVNFVSDRIATGYVIWNVLNVGHRPCSRGHIKAADLDADAVASLELVCGRDDLNFILDDLARRNGRDRLFRQLVEGLSGCGAVRVSCAVRSLQPAAGEFALR